MPFSSPAFAVYRNTVARGAVEALRAAYPTVDMLVGDEMFTQVALDYRREKPPTSPVLSDYGKGFAAFLERQPWTCELPYLADVARLDRLWLEAFLARNAASLPPSLTSETRIALHPATRFAWLTSPAMTIWQAHRDPMELTELNPDWIEEGALFTRAGLNVRAELIDAPFHQFLIACAAPALVADVIASVAANCPHADVPDLLRRGVVSGAVILIQ